MTTEGQGSSNGTKVLWGILIALAALLVLFAAFLIGGALAGSNASQPGEDTGSPGGDIQYLPVPTPASDQPALMSGTSLNVREGPGTEYASYGLLQPGQMAQVVGKNAAGTWWAISIPQVPDGRGWCSADYVITQNVESVPVIE
jgi:uncharacterized protein YgiM (DUF1202 family)